MRKLIDFDDETFSKLKELGRTRMASLQELADEAFADLFNKHGVPIDLRDALRKSARVASAGAPAARMQARPVSAVRKSASRPRGKASGR